MASAQRGHHARQEVRAGATTFLVMAYIIFVNPAILSFAGVPALQGQGPPFAAAVAATCLVAAVATMAHGARHQLPPGHRLRDGAERRGRLPARRAARAPWQGAMGVIFLGGRRHHRPRADRLPGSGDERHPDGPQAGDLGRHRPLHPLHRPLPGGVRVPVEVGQRWHPGDARGTSPRPKVVVAVMGLLMTHRPGRPAGPGRSSSGSCSPPSWPPRSRHHRAPVSTVPGRRCCRRSSPCLTSPRLGAGVNLEVFVRLASSPRCSPSSR